MAKSEEIGNRETQRNTSMQINGIPRDLLQRFIPNNHLSLKTLQQSEEDAEDLELSLGLSLNGRFGVDPRAKRLTRSSSIPDFLSINPVRKDNNDPSCVLPMSCAPLVRTCSLPTETEEEWRKRKELQTLRRMEAKRKRSEKQRNLKALRDRNRSFGEENCEEDKREDAVSGNSNDLSPFAVHSWVNVGKAASGIEGKGEKANDLQQGSQGSGSSVISEHETQSVLGSNKCPEARSPASVHSVLEKEQKSMTIPGRIGTEKSGKFAGVLMENQSIKPAGVKEAVRNILEDMPCVSTTGDGPNGKRIEGFLYRYRKGEEVRIVCVCHGSFLSPAEFVKHAGGGDVAHPLKHIVVNPSSLL